MRRLIIGRSHRQRHPQLRHQRDDVRGSGLHEYREHRRPAKILQPGSNSQTISTNTWTSVTWASQITGSNMSFSGPATQLVIPIDGLYHVACSTSFVANGTGYRVFGISVNASLFNQ